MTTFTPSIRAGQALQPRFGGRCVNASALGDSFMGRDCFGDDVEQVYWQHDASTNDRHTCRATVASLRVIEEA